MAEIASIDLTYTQRRSLVVPLYEMVRLLKAHSGNIRRMSQKAAGNSRYAAQEAAELEMFKARDKQLRSQIEAASEPIWAALKNSGMEPLLKLEASRPKLFRGEGAELLASIVVLLSEEAHAELVYAAVRAARHDPNFQVLHAIQEEQFEAVDQWSQAHPGQLREQLKRGSLLEALDNIKDWCDDKNYREDLEHAGLKVATIPSGEVRLMPSDSFYALGAYLSCCIGNDEDYTARCNNRTSAFVCVYDPQTGLPIGLTELRSSGGGTYGRVEFGEAQSRLQREGSSRDKPQWLLDLQKLVEGVEGHRKVAAWLGIDLGQEYIIEIAGDCDQEDYWWEMDACPDVPFGQDSCYSFAEVSRAIAMGEVRYDDAHHNIKRYLGDGYLDTFKQELLEVCDKQDSRCSRAVRELIEL